MTLSWDNGQLRTSIHTTVFASNYRYYLINVTFFGHKKQNSLDCFQKERKNRIHNFKTFK